MRFRPWLLFLSVSLALAQGVPGRYLVELTAEPSLGASKTAAARAARGQQQAVRAAVESAGADVLEAVDNIANVLIVRIADAQAARLAAIPGVKRVRQARQMRLLLDAALPLHKVPEAWNRIGADQAGLGVKIGIIDTGIDIDHPGMQDASLTPPAGFPKTNADSDQAFTNGKVIVARSYSKLFRTLEEDASARDRVGHGTAAAMAAAGAANTGPLGPLTGVAPKAFLGSYKVFGSTGVNDSTSSDIILKAVSDAVADGMDVVSLSLGGALAPRLEDDIEVDALERAVAAGVVVVAAAGNTGPDLNTMSSPGTAPSVLTVGAQVNARTFGGSVTIEGAAPFLAVPGTGENSREPIKASAVDVETLDRNGLACRTLPADSLKGKIAFILRGTCFFSDKLTNAQSAGAVAALVYTDAARPEVITMDVQEATLPAAMVSNADGVAIKQLLAAQAGLEISIRFTIGPVPVNSNRAASFSARGPNVDESIKPDLLAAGTDIYTAAQRAVPDGDVYGASGYVLVSGTSFSTPLAAGAVALVKGARPGLTTAQYRSLLVNSAAPLNARLLQGGVGSLDVDAAVRSTLAVTPIALSFRTGGADPKLSRTLTIANVGASAGDYTLKVDSRDSRPGPAIPIDTLHLDAGKSADLTVNFTASGLAPGAYEGFITITDPNTRVDTRVPYWYAVPSTVPAGISLLDASDTSKPGTRLRDAIVFRVTDASGVILRGVDPQVTVVSGGGEVSSVASLNRDIPGAYGVTVRLGARAGDNVFRIEVGELRRDITIVGR
ncbi:MAG: S8 family serine peptidase [Acidobacteria bacterium]|nr:S8 family serine peptidase [Acidobacteriota bacterium]